MFGILLICALVCCTAHHTQSMTGEKKRSKSA